jgi:hypothetical protein
MRKKTINKGIIAIPVALGKVMVISRFNRKDAENWPAEVKREITGV